MRYARRLRVCFYREKKRPPEATNVRAIRPLATRVTPRGACISIDELRASSRLARNSSHLQAGHGDI